MICVSDCGKPTVANGNYNVSDGTKFGNIATFTCNSGYINMGADSAFCTGSGSWNASANCTAVGM
jgi:Sushi repeat (SCR repeat)